MRILVELLQDYTVIKNETSLTISDIPEKITMYLQAKKLEGLSDLTLQNKTREIFPSLDIINQSISSLLITDF